MKTILVPIDFSPATPRVCDTAATLAKGLAARLVLFHLIEPAPIMLYDAYAFSGAVLNDVVDAARKVAKRKLATLQQRYTKRGLSVQVAQQVGEPVTEIVAKIVAQRPICVVLGSHGHGAVFDLLIGSTAQGVLRKSPVPVLVVPIKRYRRL